jgi:hypothetical protein
LLIFAFGLSCSNADAEGLESTTSARYGHILVLYKFTFDEDFILLGIFRLRGWNRGYNRLGTKGYNAQDVQLPSRKKGGGLFEGENVKFDFKDGIFSWQRCLPFHR